jgi:hypothetical protein
VKTRLAFVPCVAVALAALVFPGSAQAGDQGGWRYDPSGGLPGRIVTDPYFCSDGPVQNFYQTDYYGRQAPAVHLGHVYRPYYRYAAHRVFPKTYACDGYWRYYSGWHRF